MTGENQKYITSAEGEGRDFTAYIILFVILRTSPIVTKFHQKPIHRKFSC